MKTKILSLASLFTVALLLTPECVAQDPNLPVQPVTISFATVGEPQKEKEPARKFNLDFGGGTPQQLVAAIEKATGEPLNAIISKQDEEMTLPALKMRQVTVEDLFNAIAQGSRRMEMFVTGTYFSGGTTVPQYSQKETSFGFRKVGNVWVFFSEKVPPPVDTTTVKTRFYQLHPYLEQSSIEDITTAIQTAWKMMGEYKPPRIPNRATDLKFHKETGLLIAVGDPNQVQVIDDVLTALRPELAKGLLPIEQPPKTNAPTKKPATAN